MITEEYSEESEETDEGPPELPPLSLDIPLEEEIRRPTHLFTFEGKWEGLSEDTPITPGKYKDPGVVFKVELPDISTEIEPLPEGEKEIIDAETKLSQEDVMNEMEKINIDRLIESIEGGKKAGFTLPELNSFAKQLGIQVTGLKKVGTAQKILDKIKLKTESTN